MSDLESSVGDDELSLPKATVYKMISDILPSDMTCTRSTRNLVIDCCVEFIHLIASEANEICEKDQRKTITPEHVLAALKTLGFEEFVEEVEKVGNEHRQQIKERERKHTKLSHSGLSEEELLRQQQELFKQSRLRYEQQIRARETTEAASTSKEEKEPDEA